MPFIGVELNGSKRWIDFPYLPRFQPIELVKPFFVIVLAKIIVSNNGSKTYFKYLQSLLILFFIVFLLVNQPDLGQALLVIFSWTITIFVSGINMIVLSSCVFVSFVVILFSISVLIFNSFSKKKFQLEDFISFYKNNNKVGVYKFKNNNFFYDYGTVKSYDWVAYSGF